MRYSRGAAASAALCLAVLGGTGLAQDVPEAMAACISSGTKVRHTFISHSDPARLREAVRLFEAKAPDADYPEGTVIRMLPSEAMVKRAKTAFPGSNGWEYFVLGVTAEGTTVRARGEAASNRLGTCQSCHVRAASADYLCGAGECGALPITEAQIGQMQAADPRCSK